MDSLNCLGKTVIVTWFDRSLLGNISINGSILILLKMFFLSSIYFKICSYFVIFKVIIGEYLLA